LKHDGKLLTSVKELHTGRTMHSTLEGSGSSDPRLRFQSEESAILRASMSLLPADWL